MVFYDGYQLCSMCNWITWGVFGLLMAVAGGVIGAFMLPCLGFGFAGVSAGSCAASRQGPAVAAGSMFAICQSLGATGLGSLLFGAIGSVIGGAGAYGLIYNYPEKFNWCGCE